MFGQMSELMSMFFGHPAGGTEDRTPGIIDCAPGERTVMSSPALLREGSVPGNERWAVAAWPDRKRGKKERSLAADEARKE